MKKLFFIRLITLSLIFTIATPSKIQSTGSLTEHPNSIYISPEIISLMSNNFFWLTATTPFLISAIKRIKVISNEKKVLQQENCIDPNPEVIHFIKTELKKITNKDIDTVVIHPLLSDIQNMLSLSKSIVMAQCVADEITKALKENDTLILDKWRAIIQHEASHIKNNDVFWRAIFELTTPFIIGGSISYIVNTYKNLPFWHKQYLMVYSGFISYALSSFVKSIFYKHQEQRADDNIINETQLLNGMKSFLNDFEEINKKNYIFPKSTYPFIRWYFNLFEDHPLNNKRITKLDQRIKSLEKQSKIVRKVD